MSKRTSLLLTLLFCWAGISIASEGYLGVTLEDHQGPNGAQIRIANVMDDGAAFTYGLMENDIITMLDGTPQHNVASLNMGMQNLKWGDKVQLSIIRDGKPMDKTVVLGYAAHTKTYEILKSEQIDGTVHWYFSDNTTIVMEGDAPVSITKKSEDGEKSTVSLTAVSDWSALPQNMLDLRDKLEVIAYTVAEQKAAGEDADRITFVKELLPMGAQDAARVIEADLSEVTVAPNPSRGVFRIDIRSAEKGEMEWAVYDMRGARIAGGTQESFNGSFTESIDLSGKYAGLFLLKVQVGDHTVSRSLILQ